MYQVNATYRVSKVILFKLNAIQKFFGAQDKETIYTPGSVQFTADTMGECMSKLGYLVSDVSTIEEMNIRRI